MKIVVPTNDTAGTKGTVSDHFGRCESYTFVDENGNILKTIENTSRHMGGKGLPPELMKEHGADILLCKGLGSKAISMCKELGISVYISREAETVGDIFEAWKEGRAVGADEDSACKEERQ